MVSMVSRHFWALVIALLLWGVSFAAMKWALDTNHPFTILFYRFIITFVMLLPFFFSKFKENMEIIKKHKALFILGVFNFLGMGFQITGIKYTTATKSAIITQMFMITVPVLAYFFLNERLNARKAFGIIFSLAGAVILSTNLEFGNLLNKGTVVGDLLTLGSVIFWSFFIILTRKYTVKFKGFFLLFASVAATAILTVPTVLISGQLAIDGTGLWVAIFLAIFCTIIPTLLYNYALKQLDAITSTIVSPIEILSAALLAMIFLGETLTPVEYFGGFLVVASVYVVLGRPFKRPYTERKAVGSK